MHGLLALVMYEPWHGYVMDATHTVLTDDVRVYYWCDVSNSKLFNHFCIKYSFPVTEAAQAVKGACTYTCDSSPFHLATTVAYLCSVVRSSKLKFNYEVWCTCRFLEIECAMGSPSLQLSKSTLLLLHLTRS